jgi:hypothetical protein
VEVRNTSRANLTFRNPRLRSETWGTRRSGISYAFLLLCFAFLPTTLLAKKSHQKAANAPANAAQPEVSIPVQALGYLPSGALPAFYYHALVGVHFIDETHLLFTFDIKSLLRRDDTCSASDSQRMVRAVVLDIPSGKVEKQTEWELYDFDDYLWGLGNGQFLLRRCTQLDLVGATLDLHPFLNASGAIQEILFSPDRSVVVVEETSKEAGKGSVSPQILSSTVGQPTPPEVNVSFIRLDTPGIIARARIPLAGEIPVVAEGILEALGGPHNNWTIDIQPFQGAEGTGRNIVTMQSFCTPTITAISKDVFVAMTCPKADEMAYQAYNFQGGHMWQMPFATDRWLPRFILTRDGTHFAIETLHLKHPRAALDPLTKEEVDGQAIDIYDTHTGILIGSFRTTPVYTAGQNANFSPDGTRLAVLHDGAIEIYTLNELAKSRQ